MNRSLMFVAISMALVWDTCTTCFVRNNIRGECVPVRQCDSAMRILRSNPTWKTSNSLRRRVCGFQGEVAKVCCETQPRATQAAPALEDSVVPTKPSPGSADVSSHPRLRLFDQENCGPVATQTRIYGGTESRLFEFPWMALLIYSNGDSKDTEFRCGASIVNDRYVMTAAHCVKNLPDYLKLVGVRVGEHDLSKEIDCEIYDNGSAKICAEKHRDFGIEGIFPHPEYSVTTLKNDIALIRLDDRLSFESASVRPICLPLGPPTSRFWRRLEEGRSSGQVSGWGAREDGARMSPVLRKLRLPVLSREACSRAWRGQWVSPGPKQLCAGGGLGLDSCTGDSGGPLQTLAPYGPGRLRTVQLGVVSFGKRSCGEEGMPGVYTSVRHYLHWILDTVRE